MNIHHQLHAAVPEPPDGHDRAAQVERRARRRVRRQRYGAAAAAAAAVGVLALLPQVIGGSSTGSNPGPATQPLTPPTPTDGAAVEAPDACVPVTQATKQDPTDGEPVWLRFCPGPENETRWARVPDDVLTTDLGFVSAWTTGVRHSCPHSYSQDFRLQVGYADGSVAQVTGSYGPCQATVSGSSSTNTAGSQVYAGAMAAFGRHYAAQFDEATPNDPLRCPKNLTKPGETDVDGASTSLDVGVGMPLTATAGVLCSWNAPTAPESTPLTAERAEQIRIGMHAIPGGIVDCGASAREPSYGVVLQDKTGTRRTFTVSGPECGTVYSDFENGPHGLADPGLLGN